MSPKKTDRSQSRPRSSVAAEEKPEAYGPRAAIPVGVDNLEEFAHRLQTESQRLLAMLKYAREKKLDILVVKNLPSVGHGIDQVASFISAVAKATSLSSMEQPIADALEKARRKQK